MRVFLAQKYAIFTIFYEYHNILFYCCIKVTLYNDNNS